MGCTEGTCWEQRSSTSQAWKTKARNPSLSQRCQGYCSSFTQRETQKERLRFCSKENKKPKKSYGRNLRWKSCILEFMSRVFGLTSFLHQLEASSPCHNNDCSWFYKLTSDLLLTLISLDKTSSSVFSKKNFLSTTKKVDIGKTRTRRTRTRS
jgi:hypothetical protein